MPWWVLTYLDNDRWQTGLVVLAQTNHPAHLIMAWSTTKPARRPIYRIVRGKRVFCGYKYVWDTPNLLEQTQPLDTFQHIFGPIALQPPDHVWYLLSSTRKLYERYCQSALIHVPPLEPQMASARIFHSVDQPVPSLADTFLTFDSVQWDDYYFYDPAEPTKLTVPSGGLYEFGACASFDVPAGNTCHLGISLNAGPELVKDSQHQGFVALRPYLISLHTLSRLQPGDFLEVQVYHTAGVAKDVLAVDHYSPHFWIRLAGAYPVSPP